jgi:hypothetical protein
VPRRSRSPLKPSSAPPAALASAFAVVRRAAGGLPEIEESTSYGTPALKVRGKLVARLREDGETLVLRTDLDSRDAMLRAQPSLFYITDHYRDYPAILLRLKVVRPAQLEDLVKDSWRLVAPRSLVAGHPASKASSKSRTRK